MRALQRANGQALKSGFLFVWLLIGFSSHASCARMQDFPFCAPLENGEYKGAVRIAVPREILARTDPFPLGLRVFDNLGTEVPFFIDIPQPPMSRRISWKTAGAKNIAQGKVFLLSREGGGLVDNLEVMPRTGLTFSSVSVFSPIEGGQWQLLARESIIDLRPGYSASHMDIDLPATAALQLKVVISASGHAAGQGFCLMPGGGDMQAIPPLAPLDEVQGFASMVRERAGEGQVLDDAVFDGPENKLDDRGDTIIDLGRVGLPVNRISILVSSPCFYRDVEFLAAERAEASLYRLKAAGSIYSVPDLGLSKDTLVSGIDRAPFVKVRMLNKGAPPVHITRVSLQWPRRYLYFSPVLGRSYSIYFGRDLPSAPGTRFEGERREYFLSHPGEVAEWKIRKPSENEAYRPYRAMRDHLRPVFIMGIVFLVIYCIGFWFIQMKKTMPG